MILDILDHTRRTHLILLDCVVRSKGKQNCRKAMIRQAPHPFNCRNWFAADVLCSNVPSPCLPKSPCTLSKVVLPGHLSKRGASTHPSEYCNILPFFDHAIQFTPGSTLSVLLRTRIVFGVSAVGGLETLQTRRSPSDVCVANISDFCLADEVCHAKLTIGEGARAVVNVCKIVNAGCRATIKIEPFMYLTLD